MANMIFKRDSVVYSRFISFLQIDIDENAERLVVIDRKTFKLIIAGVIPPSTIGKYQTPMKYANANDLIVAIIDDDGQYNIKAVDGVKTEILSTPVDFSQ